MIKSHAQKNTDPKGARLKQEFNNFYQYNRDTNTVMPYLEFLNKFESMCLQLHGKEREPTDEEKSERLVFALHRPLFDSYITNLLATNEFPSFSELKERLRNLEMNRDISDYNNLKVTKTNAENTKSLAVTVNNDNSKNKKKNNKRKREEKSQNNSDNNEKPTKKFNKFQNKSNNKFNNNLPKQCGNCLRNHSGKCRDPLVQCKHCHKMGHQSLVCNSKKNGYAACTGCNNHTNNDTQTKVLVTKNFDEIEDLANEFVHAYVGRNNSLSETDQSDDDDCEINYGLVLSDNSTKHLNNQITIL
mmetsp:Transcript_14600/g.13191  ORF Transcript_14600/g.13191 Transcript_14600/m.13191 type:complete len:302 (-) Transcript_14600:4473-5378(-)